MGFSFRKSVNLGNGFRLNFSKSGVGYSWGMKGLRFTKRAGNSGCLSSLLMICFVWPLQLCFWMVYGVFWLIWQMCRWGVKIFIALIVYLISLIKSKKQGVEAIQQEIQSEQEMNVAQQED